MSWWQLEGNGQEMLGGYNGDLLGQAAAVPGVVGTGLAMDGVDDGLAVAAAPALDLGAGEGMTIELWINPEVLSGHRPIVEWNEGPGQSGLGVHLWHSFGSAGSLFISLPGADGSPNAYMSSPANVVVAGEWQHVAFTYDRASGVGKFYRNGDQVASEVIGTVRAQTTYNFYVGLRAGGPAAGARFLGAVDELALYDHALSGEVVGALYAAGADGKCNESTAPVILTHPASLSVHEGGDATFSVTSLGSFPKFHQWLFEGEELAGATGPVLHLVQIGAAQAGAYSVVVSNSAGVVTSDAAILTVGSPLPCQPASPGLVAWWPLDGNGDDVLGQNGGGLSGSPATIAGKVATALLFDGVDDHVSVPASPDLDLGVGDGLTIELWINPSVLNGYRPIVEWNEGPGGPAPVSLGDSSRLGLHLWHSFGAAGRLFVSMPGAAGSPDGYMSSHGGVLTAGQWQHVAFTYDKVSGIGTLVRNGVVVASKLIGTVHARTSSNFYIGVRAGGPLEGARMMGGLDEVSLYSRALSLEELQVIHHVGAAGKCNEDAPPTILQQPMSVTMSGEPNVSFEVLATGSFPLSYQWFFDGVELPGQTGRGLELLGVTEQDAGAYSVVVSNSLGSVTSDEAILTVQMVEPSILTGPASQVALEGSDVTFSVTATGTLPLAYQWSFNGAELEGETGSTLVLLSVGLAQEGEYEVRVTNSGGSAESAVATLAVHPPPPCLPVLGDTVSWWRLNDDAADQVGGHHGELAGDPAFVPGVVGAALMFDGLDDQVSVPASPGLDLGAGDGMTIELWIKPGSLDGHRPIVEWNQGPREEPADPGDPYSLPESMETSRLGLHFWHSFGAQGRLFISMPGAEGSPNGHMSTPGGVLTSGEWQHVAFSYDKTTGIGKLFHNGQVVTVAEIGVVRAQTTHNFYLGVRAGGPLAGARLEGALDEVALYSRSLAEEEILAIYLAGVSGKCQEEAPPVILADPSGAAVREGETVTFEVVATGSFPLSYQWLLDGQEMDGEVSRTLRLTDVLSHQAGDYSVVVSNSLGEVTSGPATLTVELSPIILVQPLGRLVREGEDVTLSVVAAGGAPLAYQWFLDGNLVDGATSPELQLIGVAQSDAGVYTVSVSNAFGNADSAPAEIIVDDSPLGTGTGNVNFSNVGTGKVFDVDGVTRVPTGQTFLAQLYSGAVATVLRPTGGPVGFVAPGLFFGGLRTIPSVPAGGLAVVQVRVWESAFGATFEEAAAAGAKTGMSSILQVVTGGSGIPPTLPSTLFVGDFSLQPGVPPAGGGGGHSIAAARISELQWRVDGVVQFRLTGTPGGHHALQVSSDLIHWEPWRELADCPGTCEVVDPEAQIWPRRFYRVISW